MKDAFESLREFLCSILDSIENFFEVLVDHLPLRAEERRSGGDHFVPGKWDHLALNVAYFFGIFGFFIGGYLGWNTGGVGGVIIFGPIVAGVLGIVGFFIVPALRLLFVLFFFALGFAAIGGVLYLIFGLILPSLWGVGI